jgi:hypothetical protein
MSKYTIVGIVVLSLLLVGSGAALKKQIEVNGEQRARIEEQATAMKAAEKWKKEAEAATAQRDADMVKITQTNRRLRDEINKANAGDDCARRDIPIWLDRLFKQLAPKAGESVPARNPATG